MKNTNLQAIGALFLFLLTVSLSFAQDTIKEVYKIASKDSLGLEIFIPDDTNSLRPAMIFFFGGGWNGGSPDQFRPHAAFFAQKGMVTVLADYRVRSRHQTSPFEALEDARAAMRYLKLNAEKWGIDSSRIVASGGSAGGHLAAATALTKIVDTSQENYPDPKPAALVLFNPVIDNGPGGYGYERIGAHYKEFSPIHNITEGAPPTLFFLGTEDRLIPVITAQYYQMVMEKVGSYCELILYEGEGHGFFNFKNHDIYQQTIEETSDFLIKQGFIAE
ncbi:alpha/beta hydrolase [Cyclobacterium plantarum]|uniref:Alpha/beta hydrolase n=1 Tax=Cyclobacterium plantarum TaxID=2716263 RepID=A0ABX0H4F9_9BACT|nr:alpha/beta hydrolase [Cyclobacterium plantarum]NHE56382.1 alpha/beta hydrolase [Cyclobacterium plantarum]